jgi:phosphoglycerate dehydrogenase-like enzyme
MRWVLALSGAVGVAVMLAGNARAAEDAAQLIKELGLKEAPVALRDTKDWTPPKKIVVLSDSPSRAAWFQEVAKGVTILPAGGPREAKGQMADADAVVGLCLAEMIDAAPKLKWIQSQGAGVDECITLPKVAKGGILVTNMQRVNGPNIAEHTMGLVLTLSRQLAAFTGNQRDEKWNQRPPAKLIDLEGRTMLIVGLGGIGTEIAERAHAFKMRIIATRATGHEGPSYVEYVGLADELPKLIGQADFVIDVLPLTPDTQGTFNAAMFARMKPTAYFFNVGRGQTVVTDDLVAALNTKKIAGAGLDVTDPEPLPKGHPLWKTPNTVITPHVAGSSDLKFERAWIVMRENLRRYVAGEKMLSVVDIKRGY